jgi:hypothetical protein
MTSVTSFEIGSEYELLDSNIIIYLGIFEKNELVSMGGHASRYNFYFTKNEITYKYDVVAHPVNPAFSNIRKKIA